MDHDGCISRSSKADINDARKDGIASQGEPLIIGEPFLEDGPAIYDLIGQSPPLDLNSRYCYLLLCSHFRSTCAVARSGDRLAGFISAYVPPESPDVLFVWQVAIDEQFRCRGLASSMLDSLLARPCLANISRIETTVTPGNRASEGLFRSFARKRGANCQFSLFFGSTLFGPQRHEKEVLFTIGPFNKKSIETGVNHENI
jgi:L-2,4-diaminobutyric acid acetyltransferase